MKTSLNILIILASIAVVLSLTLGLYALILKKGSAKIQNKMMQARIFFQLIALIILGLIFYVQKSS